MTTSKTPSFADQQPDTPIAQIVSCMVLFTESDEAYCSGTATAICRNLHITAKHVIEDFARLHGSVDGSVADVDASLWLLHTYPGPAYAVWEVDQVCLSPHTDIAFLHTKPYNDVAAAHESRQIRLDLAPPHIGQRISGFGYRASQGHFSRNPDGTRHLEVNGTPTATVGEVVEVFPENRDNFRLSFPCFRVNARFDGGMSGGPLITDSGQMCGVICSTLPPEQVDGEHISYGATLWPSMATLIDFPAPILGKRQDKYPVLDLVRAGIVSAINHDLIRLVGMDGGLFGIQYAG